MRSAALLIIVFGSVPLILGKPYLGALMWAWLSYFNPHLFLWDEARYTSSYAMIAALVTLCAWMLSHEPKWIPRNAIIILMLAFAAWTSFTTLFALVPVEAWKMWEEFIKIVLMSYVTFQLIQTKQRIQILLWVIVLSVGFYGVKGGVFVFLTGGEFMVLGPHRTAFGSNNSVGIALAMILPLMRCLQQDAKSRLLYWALMGAMFLTGISILSTYSRGAVLALCGMVGFLWLKSRYKMFTGIVAAVAVLVALAVMPDKWFDRVESIQNYQDDWSSMDRLKMWRYGLNVAAARPFVGGGFGIFPQRELYPNFGLSICGPNWPSLPPATNCVIKRRTSHNIFFDAIGEHGYVGFVLYVLLGLMGMWGAQRISMQCAGRADLVWARNFAAMSQTSLAAFAFGGLFVNMTYFDLYYHVLVMVAATQVVVARTLAVGEREVPQVPLGAVQVAGGD